MKHKTAELEGALLHCALLHYFFGLHAGLHDNAFSSDDWVGYAREAGEPPVVYGWEQVGPIIEREHIGVYARAGFWRAHIPGVGRTLAEEADGPTPLIAAMRAFVASKMGEEVELP